ncbi:DUF2089 domain-containing protein [Pontiellaceae bacterium B12227]|nr:DUF2089 domain-containing protein [Pontiellaceae bacterium B12227]
MNDFSAKCNSCGGALAISELKCRDCDLTLSGTVDLPRLARLPSEDREFIELFVLAGGSLKEVGKHLKLSYPTVRNRLDKVIANLKQLDEDKRLARAEIIDALERGDISSDTALERLSKI